MLPDDRAGDGSSRSTRQVAWFAWSRPTCRDGKCERVTFRNVPCFVLHLQKPVEVAGLGTVMADAAYGGMMYVIVNAQGARLHDRTIGSPRSGCGRTGGSRPPPPSNCLPCIQQNPEIHTINQTLFAGPLSTGAGRQQDGAQRRDLSPGGSTARPAAPGRPPGSPFCMRKISSSPARYSITSRSSTSHFFGRIVETTTVGDLPAIVNTISGRGWITDITQYGVDPDRPLPVRLYVGRHLVRMNGEESN